MPVHLLDDSMEFPDPRLAEPSGLVAVGGDLSVERLISAYSVGIFPWYSEGQPILWFSPDPRLVLFPYKFKVSRSLKKIVNSGKFEVRFDTDFEGVIRGCAQTKRKGQCGTWITKDMIGAYIELHNNGYAHSVETYLDGKLAGGLYGVSLGGAFFGESMFYRISNASKVALYHLVDRCIKWDFDFIDSQIPTSHMKQFGAEEISREAFLSMLRETLKRQTRRYKWSYTD